MAVIALFLVVLAVSVRAYDVQRLGPITRAPVKTEVLPPAQFFVPLTEKVSRSAHKKELFRALRESGNGPQSYTATLAGAADDIEYVTDITIGGQNFKVVVDTGS